jgi:membrane-bound metal-dependent hydrolase YbcI (DUF457 family)
MPSPIAHVVAGWTAGVLGGSAGVASIDAAAPENQHRPLGWASPLLLLAAFIGASPDLDLLVGGWHRAGTHSLLATALLMIIAAAVTGQVTGRINWRIVAIIGGAHASHLLLDWLGSDPTAPKGIQLLWPFDRHYFISGWDLFPRTERRLSDPTFISANLKAAAVELAITLPIALAAWRWTGRKKSNTERTEFTEKKI